MGPMALQRATYRPRHAEHTVLHAVIREHLEPFLQAVSDQGDGSGLPRFVAALPHSPAPEAAPLLALCPLLDDGPAATQDTSGPRAIALATLAVAPHEAGRPRVPWAGFAMETGPGRR